MRALAAALVAGAVALAGIFVLRDDARYLYDRLTDQALPLVILIGRLRAGGAGAARPRRVRAAPARSPLAPWSRWSGDGASRSSRTCCRRASRSPRAPRTSDTLTAVLIVFGAAVVLVLPAFGLLYTLTQRSMLAREASSTRCQGSEPAPERRRRHDGGRVPRALRGGLQLGPLG